MPLSFLQNSNLMPQAGTAVGDTSGQMDPGLQQILSLIQRLDVPSQMKPPTPPPNPSAIQSILGGVGDALSAMGAVRAGGAPPAIGSFRAANLARQKQYEQEQEQYQAQQAQDEMNRRNFARTLAGGYINDQATFNREKELALLKDKLVSDRSGDKPTLQKLADGSLAWVYPPDASGNPRVVPAGAMGQPEKTRKVPVYDAQNNLHIVDLDTGEVSQPNAPIQKPPSQQQEVAARSSAILKLRLGEARDLITQPGSRWSRIWQDLASRDPTGIISGSDYASNAATYQSFINEIGSLTRTLYGAQGIRSYDEIVRLINAMPKFSAGQARIKQQFDALQKAIDVADAELRKTRPDLVPAIEPRLGPVPSHGTATNPADDIYNEWLRKQSGGAAGK